jgi:hypothetical protein
MKFVAAQMNERRVVGEGPHSRTFTKNVPFLNEWNVGRRRCCCCQLPPRRDAMKNVLNKLVFSLKIDCIVLPKNIARETYTYSSLKIEKHSIQKIIG